MSLSGKDCFLGPPTLLVGMRDPSSVTPLGLYQLHTLYLGQPVGSLPLAHLLR